MREMVRTFDLVEIASAIGLVGLGLCAVFAVAGIVVLISGWRTLPGNTRIVRVCCVMVAASVGILFAGALFAGFPFWGRHLAPLFPVYVLILGFLLHGSIQSGKLGSISVWVLVTMLLISSVQLRFADAHAKDDYRQAAAIAKAMANDGRVVWWAADPLAGQYYGLWPELADHRIRLSEIDQPLVDLRELPAVVIAINRRPDQLDQLPLPELVILSKRDIYDVGGHLQEWLAAHSFRLQRRLPAFEIWKTQKPAEYPADRAD